MMIIMTMVIYDRHIFIVQTIARLHLIGQHNYQNFKRVDQQKSTMKIFKKLNC